MPVTTSKIAVYAPALGTDPRQVVAIARQYAFAGIGFPVQSPLVNLTELSGTGLREFKHLIQANSLTLANLSLDAGASGLSAKADIDRLLSHVNLACQTASAHQCKTLRFNVGLFPKIPPTAALAEIAAIADHFGVFIAFRSDLTPLTLLADAIESIGCPFFGIDIDPPSLLAQNVSASKAFDIAEGMLQHITARDALVGMNNLIQPAALGQGSVDWMKIFSLLKESDYQGWITIDPMSLADRLSNALAGLAFLQSLFRL